MKPNVLLIVLDAVRADHLSCYGYQRETTPFLDVFADECAVYTNAYTAACWTLPSFASMFTGTCVSRHGVGSQRTGLMKLSDPRLVTIAECLRAYGYQTAALTNCEFLTRQQHLDRGFEYFRFMRELVEPSHPLHTSRLFGRYWGRWLNRLYQEFVYDRGDKGASVTYKEFVRWFSHIRTADKPFFLFVHLFEAHAPYWSPRSYRRLFSPVEDSLRPWVNLHVCPWYFLTGERPLTDEQLETLIDLYDAELRYLDDQLSRFIAFLDGNRVLEDTLVIVTADHGESLGEHNSLGHAGDGLYEPIIHVPLLIRFPGFASSVSRISDLVSTVDIFPTVLREAIGSVDEYLEIQLQGQDIAPTRLAEAADRLVVAESPAVPLEHIKQIAPGFDVSKWDRELRAGRWQHYKLIWNSQGHHELYDLTSDPSERQNCIDDDTTLAQFMLGKVKDWQGSFEHYRPLEGLTAEVVDEEVVCRLRDLGYLE